MPKPKPKPKPSPLSLTVTCCIASSSSLCVTLACRDSSVSLRHAPKMVAFV